MKTKFGNAIIGNHGYYKINTTSEGNFNKLLHRLIFEDFYQIKLPDNIVIHHEDGNKLNNEMWNLIPMTKEEHTKLHSPKQIAQKVKDKISKTLKGHSVSEETKTKISKTKKGSEYSKQGKRNMSKSRNTSGFYCVSTKPAKTTQGFSWIYQYRHNGKQHAIHSVNLLKLKQKVIEKGLDWLIIDEEKAIETCKQYGYDLKDLV